MLTRLLVLVSVPALLVSPVAAEQESQDNMARMAAAEREDSNKTALALWTRGRCTVLMKGVTTYVVTHDETRESELNDACFRGGNTELRSCTRLDTKAFDYLDDRAAEIAQRRSSCWSAILLWERMHDEYQHGPYAFAGPWDEILNNLGYAYWVQGLFSDAESALVACKSLAPKRPVLYMNLGDLYRDMGRVDDARAAYEMFLKLESSPQKRAAVESAINSLGQGK